VHLLHVDESGSTADPRQAYFVLAGFSVGERRGYLDSRASRLIQLADLVAYAVFRHCDAGDSRFFDVIRRDFDAEGGIVHGYREWA